MVASYASTRIVCGAASNLTATSGLILHAWNSTHHLCGITFAVRAAHVLADVCFQVLAWGSAGWRKKPCRMSACFF